MNSTLKRVSLVENFLSMFLTKANISKNIFFGSLPAILNDTWEDMILVDLLPLTDYDAYAQGMVNIFLYARTEDTMNIKPIWKLDEMERMLDEAVGNSHDRNYVLSANWRDQGYDVNRGYYYDFVNYTITVKH